MYSNVLTVSAFAALAAAATVNIQVSDSSGSLTFSPNSATANMGDTVVFTFAQGGHTVTEGQQSSACQPMDGGFYSGTQSPPTTFTVNVNDTNPMWFYCSTPGHCQAGMVGVINPPSDMTIQQFTSSAQSAKSNPAPSGVADGFGGTLNKSGGSGSSSSSATSSTSSPTTSSSSGSGSSGYGGSSGSSSSSFAVATEIPAAVALVLAGAFAAYLG